MKKNTSTQNNDEIDLFEIMRTIWDGKIKIIFITILSIIIFTFYNHFNQKSDNYKISLDINSSRYTEFVKFISINKYFKGIRLNKKRELNQETVLERFIEEFQDFEEFIYAIKNNDKIAKNISQLSRIEQQKRLYDYTKLITIKEPTLKTEDENKKENYTLIFTWHNSAEGIAILDQSLKLTLTNLENSIFKELYEYLEIKKNESVNKDLKRISYLLEQSSIAKELNIEGNLIDGLNLPQSSVSYTFNNNDLAYYLRGYIAIDKEINLIRNRTYENLVNIEKEINLLKETNINWVDYNVFLSNINLQKNSKGTSEILKKSILYGLILGLLYVLISNSLYSKKSDRKRLNY